MYYLLKTEPSEYAYEDILREGRTKWDGVKNPLAQRYISGMKRGDMCFIYHTGDIKAVVGLAKVVCEPYKGENGLWLDAKAFCGASYRISSSKNYGAFRGTQVGLPPELSDC